MKKLIFFPALLLMVVISLTSCLDGGNYTKSEVVINLTGWNLPDTSKVSVPFNVSLDAVMDNSCLSDLRFVVEEYSTFIYRGYATAIFENHGERCNEVQIAQDTLISVTLNTPGKYYFHFVKDDVFKKDSIIVIP